MSKKKKIVLSKFTLLCGAVVISHPGMHMAPGCGLDTPEI